MNTKNPHVGGTQLPLITPEASWSPPTELPDLRNKGPIDIAFDTETRDDGLSGGMGPGWPMQMGFIVGLSAAWDGGSFYAPVRHPDTENMDRERVAEWARDHLHSPNVRPVFHNAPYDLGWMRTDWNIKPPEQVDDTGGMAYMVNENRLSYSLDNLCREYDVEGKDEVLLREAAATYAVDPKKDLWRLPARYVADYAAQDTVATLALARALRPRLDEQKLERPYRLEMDLIPMVLEMQRAGVRIDTAHVEQQIEHYTKQRDEILEELARKLGVPNVVIGQCRSAKQMAEWFDAEGIGYPRTAKTNQPSFQAEWMRGHEHWLPRLVSRAEQLTEIADKFFQGFILNYVHKDRLHASVNQFRQSNEMTGGTKGTRSFRFSYSDPPLQQMPGRDGELAPAVRKSFLPEDGDLWLSADYSQQEYRLIVHYAALLDLRGGAKAAQTYCDDPDTDFHNYVVEITGLERRSAKDTNFAKSYGAGVPKFASMIGKSEEEAEAIYRQYDEEMPFVSLLADSCDKLAQKRGYITLLDGARSHFDFWECFRVQLPDGNREFLRSTTHERALQWASNIETEHGIRPRLRRSDTRKAMNRLIQGGAARQMKMAMRDCWREGIVPMLQMHDELCLSINDEAIGKRVTEIMAAVEKENLQVPMLVDAEYGVTWGHARKDKETGYSATWKEADAMRRKAKRRKR